MGRWLETGPVGDPGRVHTEGRIVRAVVEDGRDVVAAFLGTRPRQVVFTSGGSEAINAAVWGVARARPGAAMVFADVEHSAVREASARLAPTWRIGVDVHGRIDTDALGEVLERLDAAGTPAALVHCQVANHEVGTCQPVHEVIATARAHGAWVHVDAVAAAGHVPLALDELGAEFVSVSAHEFGGPPGVGALVLGRTLHLEPLLLGGDQERGRRAGFENVVGIVGFAAAAAALTEPGRLEAEAWRSRAASDAVVRAARDVGGVQVLGDRSRCVPHIVSLLVDGVEAEGVVLGLDQAGVAVHSGSACASESLAPSAVLGAMGVDAERSLRVSVGWSTTDADVEAFSQALPAVVGRLRALRA